MPDEPVWNVPAIPKLPQFNRFLKQPSAIVRAMALAAPLGQADIQIVSLGGATGGSATWTAPASLGGYVSAAIAFNATAIAVQQALDTANGGQGKSGVSVEGPAGGPYIVKSVANVTTGGVWAVGAGLTGGTGVVVTQAQVGTAGGPTFTRGADNAASVIANSQLTPYTDPRFRITGAMTDAGVHVANRLSIIDPSPMGTFQGWASTLRIDFETQASQFEIDMVAASTDVAIRVWATSPTTGLLVPHAPQPMRLPFPGSNNPFKWLVNFGSRARRQIVIESEGAMQFAGVWMARTETIYSSTYDLGPRVMVIGASGEWGQGGGNLVGSYIHDMCRLMGWGDIWVEAVSGSGFVTATTPPNGAGTATSFLQRAADVAKIQPDIVMFGGAFNDEGKGGVSQAIQSAISQALGAASSPYVIMFAPGRMNNPTPADQLMNATEQAAAAGMGISTVPSANGVYIDSVAGAAGPVCTGTGQAGGRLRTPGVALNPAFAAANLVGDGDADNYSWDAVHPSYPDGAAYLAKWGAGQLERVGFARPA